MKGISRRAVIVRSPEGSMFEEAIFIVREEFLRSPEQGREELLREAERTAEEYTASLAKRQKNQTWSCLVISRLKRSMMRFSSRLM
ncbi:MAG: hypothetical protein RR314_03785 [Oscillospiraceae bacterium]